MSSVSNGLYFLTLQLVSVMRVIYRKTRHARYLYIKRNVEKVWGARYTLGARYLSKNTVSQIYESEFITVCFVIGPAAQARIICPSLQEGIVHFNLRKFFTESKVCNEMNVSAQGKATGL